MATKSLLQLAERSNCSIQESNQASRETWFGIFFFSSLISNIPLEGSFSFQDPSLLYLFLLQKEILWIILLLL